jgi:hypothetical protein
MRRLTIPDEYVGGLAQLVTLSDQAISELRAALAETQASLDVKDSSAGASLISSKISSIPTKDLRRIMASLLSLYTVRANSDISMDDFVEDVVQAMKRSRHPELSLKTPEIDQAFRNRLGALLAVRALTIASKGVVIQHDHEHTLCTLRIFTDVRPVYGEDVTSPPSAAAITHMLKLTYHEGDEMREIHVALDKDDLLNLKSQIIRAEHKAAGLHKFFEASKLPIID